jgi:phosphoribosylanthranilate isomerase
VFKIKICGVTNVADALAVAEAGADAIGLNFFPGSSRWVNCSVAAEIARALEAKLVKVGVFVNASVDEIKRIAGEVQLDAIQLHGDEPPEFLAQLPGQVLIRAFRCGEDGLGPVIAYLAHCQQLGCTPAMVLMDAFRPGQYGGTGETINWMSLIDHREHRELPPLVLAGGLRPETVAHAISVVHPAAVDTASGVERSPGQKDPGKIHAFVQAARSGFASIVPTGSSLADRP